MINNICQWLEGCAKKTPDRIALSDEYGSITYSEYYEEACKIGTYLIQKNNTVEACMPVAVLIDRNVTSVVTFLGVAFSGCFYVPIDMSMPEERVRLILDTLNPVEILDAREQNDGKYTSVRTILDSMEKDEPLLKVVRENRIDTDPLYAIFTSGSTGVPKGVLVSHRSVIDLIEAFEDAFSFAEGTIFGNQAPFDFDVSTKDIYNSLYCCGCVKVIPKRMFVSPKLLVSFLEDEKIETIIWAVSALRILADFKALKLADGLKNLKNVMFSGEVMPVKSIRYWMENVQGARYVNLYGPTEITCNCTYHIIETSDLERDALPIGKPFKNTRVFLKGEDNEVVKRAGVEGEICVEGTCLALGYWNNKEKTEEAFKQIAVTPEYKRYMYSTGDIGYYDEAGLLYFSSRKDYQIKHMGHRIELGEIEAALNGLSFLRIGVCVFSESRQKIVCFYQAEEECRNEIVVGLSKKIPKYMWPNVFCKVDEMPMTKNGKIDRLYLKKEWEKNNG